MKSSEFRGWVHNLWIENCEERSIYQDGERMDEREYFQKFRWWLRREWRHRQQTEKHRLDRSKETHQKLQQAHRPG